MTKREQKKFIKNLSQSISLELCKKVDAGVVPDTWDGHELRQWLADKFEHETTELMKHNKRRRKDYENAIAISTL